MICDKDCFHCKFEDCINDEMDADDWRAGKEIEEILNPKSRKQKLAAAKKKAYREENRESIAAKQKAYREENRESIAAKQKADALRICRKMHGYTQRELGRMVGLTDKSIGHYENARVPFRPEMFTAVMPELERMMKT